MTQIATETVHNEYKSETIPQHLRIDSSNYKVTLTKKNYNVTAAVVKDIRNKPTIEQKNGSHVFPSL